MSGHEPMTAIGAAMRSITIAPHPLLSDLWVNFPLSLVIELVVAAVGLVDVVGVIGVEDGRAEVYART